MKNKVALCLTGLLCFMLFNLSTAWAQSPDNREAAERQNEIKPLKIGDTIPEELWNLPLQVINQPEGRDTVTLNGYRDKKLIVLDFWATWCGSCMAAFEELHDIYVTYNSEMQIVPITLEGTKHQVLKKLDQKKDRHQVDLVHLLSGAVGKRQIWQGYFPHRVIPHHVWIDPKGEVLAITDGCTTTESNISAFLEGKSFYLASKRDIVDFDRSVSLLEEGNGRNLTRLRYHSALFNYIPGVKGFVRFDFDQRDSSSIRIVNMPLLALYKIAFGRASAIWPYNPFRYDNRVELLVSNPSRWEKPFEKNMLEEWNAQNSFCYECVHPGSSIDLFSRMQKDIQQYFGVRADVVRKPRKAWIISKLADSRRGSIDMSKQSKTMVQLNDLTQVQLANYLADHYRKQPYPFVPSHEEARIDLLNVDFNKKLESTIDDLKAQGYDLVLKTVELDILVISDLEEERGKK